MGAPLQREGTSRTHYEATMKNTTKLAFAAALLLAVTAGGLRADSLATDRQENQQQRINQGEASGELTKGEAARDEAHHKAIGKEIRHDRKENGGKLTGKEKRHINRQQNRESRRIHRTKHNDRVAK
jgi:hypothetical protein